MEQKQTIYMLNRVHLAIRSRYIIYKDHEHLHLSSKRFLLDLSMSNTASILYETGTAYHLGAPDFFGRIHVTRKPKGEVKNGQSRDPCSIGHNTWNKNKQNKKHNTEN
jgi:hypothetical protein